MWSYQVITNFGRFLTMAAPHKIHTSQKKNTLPEINPSIHPPNHPSRSAPGAPSAQKKNHPAEHLHRKPAKVLKNLPRERQGRQRQLPGKQYGHPPQSGPWNALAGKRRWQLNGICCKKRSRQPRWRRSCLERLLS